MSTRDNKSSINHSDGRRYVMNHSIAPHDNWPLAIKLMNVSYLIECFCRPDYHGVFCQNRYDDCMGHDGRSKCLNDGLCVDGINNYSCTCLSGFTGTDCEIDCNQLNHDHRYVNYIDACANTTRTNSNQVTTVNPVTDYPSITNQTMKEEVNEVTSGQSTPASTPSSFSPSIPNPIPDSGTDINDLIAKEEEEEDAQEGSVIKGGNLPKWTTASKEVNEAVTSGTPMTTPKKEEETVTAIGTDNKFDPSKNDSSSGEKEKSRNEEEEDANDDHRNSINGHHSNGNGSQMNHSFPPVLSSAFPHETTTRGVFSTVTIEPTPVVVIDPTTSVFKERPISVDRSSFAVSPTAGHLPKVPDPIGFNEEDNVIDNIDHHHQWTSSHEFISPSFALEQSAISPLISEIVVTQSWPLSSSPSIVVLPSDRLHRW